MKILLVQTSFLGDLVLSTPAIQGIKTLHPDSEIWLMCTPVGQALLKSDPLINGFVIYDKHGSQKGLAGMCDVISRIRQHKFDCVYSLHKSARTSLILYLAKIPRRIGFKKSKLSFLYTEQRNRDQSQHDVLRNLQILDDKISFENNLSELRLFASDIQSISPEIRSAISQLSAYCVVAPASAWNTKMWHWQGYRQVCQHFIQLGLKIVVVGTQQEQAVCAKVSSGLDVLNLSGKTSIEEFVWVIKHSQLLICNDSLALHVASAFKIPSVGIFCATSPKFGFGPWRNRAVVVEKLDLPCKPCRPHGSKKCPTNTESCMRDLHYSKIIDAVKELGVLG